MKLYADYILERQGLSLITHERGFLAYKITGDECFIAELFVNKEFRRMNYGESLLKEVLEISLSKNCALITANIHLWDPNANSTLGAALASRFKVIDAKNGVLLVARKIKED